MKTLPSSDAEAIRESSNGLLISSQYAMLCAHNGPYQSVSSTGPVWPRKRGIISGRRPFSLIGMTAKAPPPLASQLTEMYWGFAYPHISTCVIRSGQAADLDQVSVPCVLRDAEVIVALLLRHSQRKYRGGGFEGDQHAFFAAVPKTCPRASLLGVS
jgi:hypothetical protein